MDHRQARRLEPGYYQVLGVCDETGLSYYLHRTSPGVWLVCAANGSVLSTHFTKSDALGSI